MNFAHPSLLLFALLPIAWAAWEWRSSTRWPLALKAGALAAIAVALAQPSVTVLRTKVAVVALADTSNSITEEDLATASEWARRLEDVRGSHWMRVIPFARSTRDLTPAEQTEHHFHLTRTSGQGAMATDLESAIRDGAASLPPGMIPRLLLISDGNENLGSVERAIWQTRQLGIPIDTALLRGRPQRGLRLRTVSIPGSVFSGERFPIEVTVESPAATAATVELTAEGKSIGSSQVELATGANRLALQASVNASGAIALVGAVTAPGLGDAMFEEAVTLRRPRALFVSNDPEPSERRFTGALQSNQFEVVRSRAGVPEKLDDYQLVVINNWDMHAIPAPAKARLELFVKRGGGLLWIAGERNAYVSGKPEDDPLQRVLPARLVQPRTPEGAAVVLILDKSSSMEGKKMELARLAAIGVVNNLRPIDHAGVLVFDNSQEWAVPIRKVDDPASINRLIAGVPADGGTQIAPALAEAYRRILPVNAPLKHIVLLTDGISEEGDSDAIARQADENNITISTVGLGQDVNSNFLERVAKAAGGRAYLVSELSELAQILLRDVEQHTGSTAIEKPVRPKALKRAAILEGVGFESAPQLKGYVRFESKPASDLVLEADRGDPLLVRWQYGLGRAAVFTSDAKDRWAADWMTWAGFDRLWSNIVRDLLPHAPATETTAEFDRATRELVVSYQLSRETDDLTAPAPDLYVFGPDGFRAPLRFSKAAAGIYRGRVEIGEGTGLFRVRPLSVSRAFPEVGFYRQQDELREYGSNEQLLRQIASATGGRFNPSPSSVFDSGGAGIRSSMPLWPAFLAVAILLNMVELFLRKWKGLLGSLRRGPSRTALRHPLNT